MVDPSPPIDTTDEKAQLRKRFRAVRKAHVSSIPDSLRALILNRPPAPLLQMIPAGAVIGLYHPVASEAPTLGWARWFAEHGHMVALPFFAANDAAMEFRAWEDPWNEAAIEPGPWQAGQPPADAARLDPDVIIVPLVAFTADGHRLGQGGGHYDRWLAAHPGVTAIGVAWDCQLADSLPVEDHDRPLAAIVTPTRIFSA